MDAEMSENTKLDLSGDGGVLKEIIQEGTGTETPMGGCKVSLHYTGRLTDGTIFDSSVNREPFEFDLGKGSVIKAFDMGVATMKLKEKCFLHCAPEYAYGAAGSPPSIPPNSTLIFELEMLGWKGEDVSPNSDGSIERIIIEAGSKRRTPNDGAHVKVHLVGKYEDRVFEDREVEFDYNEGEAAGVINGVECALNRMSLGETSRLKIKPSYAFGKKGHKEFNIPPNATVEYTVKLIDCEKNVDEWKLDEAERLERAKGYKEKGTKYFKTEHYSLAIKMYTKAVQLVPNDEGDNKALKVALYSNVALCHQKLNQEVEARQACNDALALDPNNIKSLYRRGQCNLLINEFEDALADFQKVVQLEPTNKAAINQIQVCKQKLRESHEKDKKLYANMFAKLAAADKQQDIKDETNVLENCGEWTDEEEAKKKEEDFERDNNIVMI